MERISPKEAARMLGIGYDSLVWYMETGELRIGSVLPSRSGKTKRHLCYRELVEKHLEKLGEEKK